MKLLHGSYTEIEKPLLEFCKTRNDFGKGFYLTTNWTRALGMAKRSCALQGVALPVVNQFLFYENRALDNGCTIKKFKGFSVEWGRFILLNRENPNYDHGFDIVIGPVADDVVQRRIDEHKSRYGLRYLEDDAIRDLISNISQFGYDYIQYCFCTEKALGELIKD